MRAAAGSTDFSNQVTHKHQSSQREAKSPGAPVLLGSPTRVFAKSTYFFVAVGACVTFV